MEGGGWRGQRGMIFKKVNLGEGGGAGVNFENAKNERGLKL